MTAARHRIARPRKSAFKGSSGRSRQRSRATFDPDSFSGGFEDGKRYRDTKVGRDSFSPSGSDNYIFGTNGYSSFPRHLHNTVKAPWGTPRNQHNSPPWGYRPSFPNSTHASFANPYSPRTFAHSSQQPSVYPPSPQTLREAWIDTFGPTKPFPAEGPSPSGPHWPSLADAPKRSSSPADLMSQYSFRPYTSTSYRRDSDTQSFDPVTGAYSHRTTSDPPTIVNLAQSLGATPQPGKPYSQPTDSKPGVFRSFVKKVLGSRDKTDSSELSQEDLAQNAGGAQTSVGDVASFLRTQAEKHQADKDRLEDQLSAVLAALQASGASPQSSALSTQPGGSNMSSMPGSSLGQGTISSGGNSGSNIPHSRDFRATPQQPYSSAQLSSQDGSGGGQIGGASFSYVPGQGTAPPTFQSNVDVAKVIDGLTRYGQEMISFLAQDAQAKDTRGFRISVAIKPGAGPHQLSAIAHGGTGSQISRNYGQNSTILPPITGPFPSARTRRTSTIGYWGQDLSAVDWDSKYREISRMMDRPDGVHVWASASQLDQWNDRDYRERMSLFNECIPFTAECLDTNPSTLSPQDRRTFDALNALMSDYADLGAPQQAAYDRVYEQCQKLTTQDSGGYPFTPSSFTQPSNFPASNIPGTTQWGTGSSKAPGSFDDLTAGVVREHFKSLPDADKESFKSLADNTLKHRSTYAEWVTRGKDYSTLDRTQQEAIKRLKSNFETVMSTLKSTHTAPTDGHSKARGEEIVRSYIDNAYNENYLGNHAREKLWEDALTELKTAGWKDNTNPTTPSMFSKAVSWVYNNPIKTVSTAYSLGRYVTGR